ESQASKIYAEQKEEEVKILENSVEELDSTINVLEKRVNEMEEELERYHRIRIHWKWNYNQYLELQEAYSRIKDLEDEIA
nr:kinesin motor domain-containing protein [Tanacetum cinerariifolium]